MAADLLVILIKANLAAAAAILLVLALRKPTRRIAGARLAYALWLAVPLVVGASLLPARKIFVVYPAEPLAVMEPLQATGFTPMASAPVIAAPDLHGIVLGLWLIGLIASGLLLIWRQNRFMASLGGIHFESGYLRAKASDAGPMVVGALRPRIILPADFEARFDAGERDVVLAHEMAHLKAGDTRINALVALAQCVGWFNPLVHIAARHLRLDQELACDAAVLATRPKDRLLYATALLKAQTHDHPLPLGCYWPAGANPLKERIIMLKSQSPSRRRAFAGAAILTGICAGAGAAAWAAQPAQTVILPLTAPAAVEPTPAAPVQLAQAVTQAPGAYPSPPRPTQIVPRPPAALSSPVAPVQVTQTDAGAPGVNPPPPRPTQLVPRPPAALPPIPVPRGAAPQATSEAKPLTPGTVTGAQATIPLPNSAETPLSLVTKSASAKSKADCLILFPLLTAGTDAQKTQRTKEQVTCLNQWNTATPSLLRQYMSSPQDRVEMRTRHTDYAYRFELEITSADKKNNTGEPLRSVRGINVAKGLATPEKEQTLADLDTQIARASGTERQWLVQIRNTVAGDL